MHRHAFVVEPQPSPFFAGDDPRDHSDHGIGGGDDGQAEQPEAQFSAAHKTSDPKPRRAEQEEREGHDRSPARDLQVDRFESGRGAHTSSVGENGERLEHD
jgi:hypothetical protein